jgi:hypothetical protein
MKWGIGQGTQNRCQQGDCNGADGGTAHENAGNCG